MTTFVSQQLTRTSAPTVDAGRVARSFASIREWGKDYAAAFRASAAAQPLEGMDRTVLLTFGRD
jgi:hypothetical protein